MTGMLLGFLFGMVASAVIAITLWSLVAMSGNHAPEETPLDNERRFK